MEKFLIQVLTIVIFVVFLLGTFCTCFAAPNGDLTGEGKADIEDALKALRISVRLIQPTDQDRAHGDVAPLDPITLQPKGDGQIDISDALAILKHAVNLYQWINIFKVKHPRLNDTGVDIWADLAANTYTSALPDFSGQDADLGRDFEARNGTLIKIGSGHAGFDFTKLDINGNELLPDASFWSCVRDNVTGLIWEIKLNDGGLRDKDNTFSWYNPDPSSNGNEPGVQNRGNCTGGIDCDTDSYVKAVNFPGLCGANNWRMPTKEELQSITDFGQLVVGIDVNFFPETKHARYWSISTYAGDPTIAWDVFFYNGSNYPDSSKYGLPPDLNDSFKWGWYVRLVHN